MPNVSTNQRVENGLLYSALTKLGSPCSGRARSDDVNFWVPFESSSTPVTLDPTLGVAPMSVTAPGGKLYKYGAACPSGCPAFCAAIPHNAENIGVARLVPPITPML